MSIQLTLLIFSGKPNPVWSISDEQYQEILRKLPVQDRSTAISGYSSGRIGLGYNGFLFTEPTHESETLKPDKLSIIGGVVSHFGVSERWALDEAGIEEEILATAPHDVVDARLKEIIKKAIEERNTKPSSTGRLSAAPPAHNDARWNAPDVVGKNNCYNYGCNRQTDTFAQPGRAAGIDIQGQEGNLDAVTKAARADGLQLLANVYPAGDPGEGNFVALGISTQLDDFHWWRLDNDTKWSHKPGGLPVEHAGQDGMEISAGHSPAIDAVRGDYDTFGGYFRVPGGVAIR
jgi:hypothetical protein